MANYVRLKGSNDIYEKAGAGILKKPTGSVDPSQVYDVGSLNDAYNEDISSQVNAQVDPYVRTAEQNAEEERNAALTGSDRITQALERVFKQRQESNPYARQGIVSSQANAVETENNANQVRQVGDDLTSKLSSIAKALTGTRTSAEQQRASLTSSLKNQYLQNNTAFQADQNSLSPLDLGNRIALVDKSGNVKSYLAKGSLASSSGGPFSGLDLKSILAGNAEGPVAASTPGKPKVETVSKDDAQGSLAQNLRSLFDSAAGKGGLSSLGNFYTEDVLLDPRNPSSPLSNPNYTTYLSPDEIRKIIYDARKPFEKTSPAYVSGTVLTGR